MGEKRGGRGREASVRTGAGSLSAGVWEVAGTGEHFEAQSSYHRKLELSKGRVGKEAHQTAALV